MTTIATDGKTMAVDSRQVGDHIDQTNTPKMWKVKDAIIGVAGDSAEGLVFVDWFKSETKDSKPDFDDGFEALVLTPKGTFWYGHRLVAVECGVPAAIGSGGAFAMGAMLAGATSKKAVTIAKKLDPKTGGPVKEMKLPQPRKKQ